MERILKNNKQVLSYCKNFEKIINTDFLEGDNLSVQLVKIYKDYIFQIDITNEEDIEKAIEIDKIMARYVDDYAFRKTLKQELLQVKIKKGCSNIYRVIVENIIEIFRKVEFEQTRKIYISKWI